MASNILLKSREIKTPEVKSEGTIPITALLPIWLMSERNLNCFWVLMAVLFNSSRVSLADDSSEQERAAKISTYMIHGSAPLSNQPRRGE